ncbi:MAG: aryl-sulfate sulfotransferase [Bacteroidota bacterium]
MRNRLFILSLLTISLLGACKQTPVIKPLSFSELEIVLNPTERSPLGALISLKTDAPASSQLRIIGKNGALSDVIHAVSALTQDHQWTVVGLYADYLNQVEISFFDAAGLEIGKDTFEIQTEPLIADMPEIEIRLAQAAAMTPGMNLVSYFGYDQNFLPLRAFMFDTYGDIRWYLDYKDDPRLSNLFYDTGLNRLQNGNLFFGNNNKDSIYEIDMLGAIQNAWGLEGYKFHHMVIEKPNGNFLLTATDPNKPTVEDIVLELDRTSGNIANLWDLNESLDNSRRAWPTDLHDLEVDWFHGNGLAYDQADGGIIVSGRSQCTVKLSPNNEVIWIIAPHKDWQQAGNGEDLNQYLLQPLDAQGNAITDSLVLEGQVDHPDFAWAWYQHSPVVLPNGNLLLFDNGDNRNYQGNGPNSYSRSVEYKIDAAAKTIQQVWDFGEENGAAGFSRVVSKTTYSVPDDHVFLSPGAISFNGEAYGLVQEIDRPNDALIFEAKVIPPVAAFGILTFHNSQRLSLYP